MSPGQLDFYFRKLGVEWVHVPAHIYARILSLCQPPLLSPRNLRRLDISDLPAVSNPGLTQILVEEMLPNCEVLGADWAQGLKSGLEEQSRDTASPIPA